MKKKLKKIDFIKLGLKSLTLYDSLVYFNLDGSPQESIEFNFELSKIRKLHIYDRIDFSHLEDAENHIRHYYFSKMVIELSRKDLTDEQIDLLDFMQLASVDLNWNDSYRDICWIESVDEKKEIKCDGDRIVITIELPKINY